MAPDPLYTPALYPGKGSSVMASAGLPHPLWFLGLANGGASQELEGRERGGEECIAVAPPTWVAVDRQLLPDNSLCLAGMTTLLGFHDCFTLSCPGVEVIVTVARPGVQ